MSLPEQTDLQMFLVSTKTKINVYHISLPLCLNCTSVSGPNMQRYFLGILKRYYSVCNSKKTAYTNFQSNKHCLNFYDTTMDVFKKKGRHQSGMFLGKGIVDYLIYSEIGS